MITVRLPNNNEYLIPFNEELTCEELCYNISKQYDPYSSIYPSSSSSSSSSINSLKSLYFHPSLNPLRCKILFHDLLLSSTQKLYEYGITAGSFLEIIETFDESFLNNEILYENYLKSISPLPGEENVSIDKQPIIFFKESNYGLHLYLQSFDNRNAIRSEIETISSSFEGEGEIDNENEINMETILGFEEAKKRGYIKWTNQIYNRYIFLLEVTNANLERQIESIRYNYYGINKFYSQGDRHSWQRYTNKLPIECFIHIDEIEQRIRLIPELKLNQSTTYCILLQHGVPTLPIDELSSSLFSFTGKGIYEDKLFFFRTQKSKIHRVSMFG